MLFFKNPTFSVLNGMFFLLDACITAGMQFAEITVEGTHAKGRSLSCPALLGFAANKHKPTNRKQYHHQWEKLAKNYSKY